MRAPGSSPARELWSGRGCWEVAAATLVTLPRVRSHACPLIRHRQGLAPLTPWDLPLSESKVHVSVTCYSESPADRRHKHLSDFYKE